MLCVQGSALDGQTSKEAQDPMYLWIDAEDVGRADFLQLGIEMTMDLVKHVLEEHTVWYQMYNLEHHPVQPQLLLEAAVKEFLNW